MNTDIVSSYKYELCEGYLEVWISHQINHIVKNQKGKLMI